MSAEGIEWVVKSLTDVRALGEQVRQPRLLELRPGVVGLREIVRPDSGRLLVTESDLVQLFDLIVEHFAMELDVPLRDHYGFWEEEMYGEDPRKPRRGAAGLADRLRALKAAA